MRLIFKLHTESTGEQNKTLYFSKELAKNGVTLVAKCCVLL